MAFIGYTPIAPIKVWLLIFSRRSRSFENMDGTKVNYTFGQDFFSDVQAGSFIPVSAGLPTNNMETKLSDLLALAQRPNFLANYSWTIASSTAMYGFPGVINEAGSTSQLTFLRQILSMFAYCKFRLKFRFKVNGSAFHAGLLQASFSPMFMEGSYVTNNLSYQRLMTLPSVRMNACGTSEYTLDVPALMNMKWMNTALCLFSTPTALPAYAYGSLFIVPVSTLNYSVGASTVVGVSIYYQVCDLMVSGPTFLYPHIQPTIRAKRAVTPAESDFAEIDSEPEHQGLVDAVVDPLAGGTKAAVSGAIDGVGSVIKSGVKTLISNIPIVGSFLSGFMDKPPLRTEPLTVVRKNATSWIHGDGVSNASTLSVLPGLFRPPKEEEIGKPGTVIDYCKIPGILFKTVLVSTASAYTRFATIGVSPSVPYSLVVSGPSIFNSEVATYDTPISYMSRMYDMWRGTLKYTLEIVTNAATTCSIGIAWVPDENLGVASWTSWSSIAGQCSVWTIDVSGPSVTHFDVKFLDSNEYKLVANPHDFGSGLQTYFESGAGTGTDGVSYMNGTLGLYLLNPIMTNVSASGSVEVRIYVAAGDDFEMAMPGGSIPFIFAYSDDSLLIKNKEPGLREINAREQRREPRPRGVHQGLTDETPVDNQQLIPSDEPTEKGKPILSQDVVMQPFFGESHMQPSLLKRYQLLWRYMKQSSDVSTAAETQNISVMFPVTPTLMAIYGLQNDLTVDTQPVNAGSTLLNHFGRAFRYWRGSINYRFIVRSNTPVIVKAMYVPYAPYFKTTAYGLHQYSANAFGQPVPILAENAKIPGWNCSFYYRETNGMPTIPDFSNPQNRWNTMTTISPQGIELATSYEGGIVDVNVPFYSERPNLLTDSNHVDVNLARNAANTWQYSTVLNSHGNIVFQIQIAQLATSVNPRWDTITFECYIAAGDDLVFSYPIVPPPVRCVKGLPASAVSMS